MATFLPAFPSLSAGAIFIKGFANNNATTATVAQYVTFAHCFQKGQIASGGGIEANIGGTVYACQIDIKTSYADGSACHTLISMQVPGIAAATTVWGQFSPASPPGGVALSLASAIGGTTLTISLAASTIPDWAANTVYARNALVKPTVGNAGGYVFQWQSNVNGTTGTSGATEPASWPQAEGNQIADNTVTWINIGVPFTGTIAQDLVAAAKNSSDLWLSGPLAVQGRAYVLPSNPGSLGNVTVNASLPAMMRLTVDLSAYADGTVLADVDVANDVIGALLTSGTSIYGGTQAYAATLTFNGSAAFSSAALLHCALEDWSWQVGTIPHVFNSSQDLTLQVVHNPTDFIEAQAVIPYDCTAGVGNDPLSPNTPLFATEAAAIVADAGFGQPLTNPGTVVNTDMPAVGVSVPNCGIGPNSFWQAAWFTTQNPSLYGTAIEGAKVNGYIPWHMWNPSTGRYWSIADDPYFFVYPAPGSSGSSNSHPPPIVSCDGVWSLDFEHYPDLTYLVYLCTGRRYFLDQLRATTLYAQELIVDYIHNLERFTATTSIRYFVSAPPVRMQGWCFRNGLYATYACPDVDTAEKAWFRKVLDNTFFWLILNFEYYQSRQGDCHGWLPGAYGTGPTAGTGMAPWQDDYTLYTVQLAATMGHPLALHIVWWMLNFRTGVLMNGAGWPPDGFPTADAVMYDYLVTRSFNNWAGLGGNWPFAVSWTGLEQLLRLDTNQAQGVGASNAANAIFSGSIESNGSLTVSSATAGTLAVGMTLFPNPDNAAGSNPMATITGRSGNDWTTDYTGSAYTGNMSASDYMQPGEYTYWFTGTGGGGGNTDNYDQLLYNTLIQAEVLGHPDALTARNTLASLTDSLGTAVPNLTSTPAWQSALMPRLATRAWNDSQIFPAAGAASGIQGQSLGLIDAAVAQIPAAPDEPVWVPPPRKRVYFGNRR